MSISSTELPTAPLVFQCANCKQIVSDSREFVCTLTTPQDGIKCVVVRGERLQDGPKTLGVESLQDTAMQATSSLALSGWCMLL
jgi:hypothetical protein